MPEWEPLMETGVAEIDRDHRELVDRINELGQAMRKGEGRQKIAELLAFLNRYVQEHFLMEEALMRASGYPGLEQHQARHEQFRRDLAARAEAFAHTPAERGVAIEIHGWLMRWLSDHTLHQDETLAVHLRSGHRG